MRILVLSPYYVPSAAFGGPPEAVHGLNRALVKRGNSVIVLTTDARDQIAELPAEVSRKRVLDGVEIHYQSRDHQMIPRSYFRSRALETALPESMNGADIATLHGTWTDINRVGAGASRRQRRPYVIYTHGSFEPWAIRHRWFKKSIYFSLLEERTYSDAAAIVVCNEKEREWLVRRGIRATIRRIPWGSDLPDLRQAPARSIVEDNFPELRERRFVLTLARLHPKKGIDLLIQAFANLSTSSRDWRLVIAGPKEGDYETTLRRLIEARGLEGRVILTGLVEGAQKRALLANAEFFALTSRSEGLPVSVLEALGYGLPCLVTKTCYVPEVRTAPAGLEVGADVKSIQVGLQRMFDDPILRQEFRINARRLAEREFSWPAIAAQTEDLYREAVGG